MAKKKNAAIEAAMADLEKRFKEPCLGKMTDLKPIETFTTGRPHLDAKIGGGYPIGKIVEIMAEEASGKTGLALEAIRECQAAGGTVVYVDAEHAFNKNYAHDVGVDTEALYISQPTTAEQTFEIIRASINTGQVDLIVVDSVSALTPKAILEGESGQAHMAVLARIMSQGMNLITGPAAQNGCTVIFINQLRDKIDAYRPTKVTSGGNALKFYAFLRLELKKIGQIKQGDEVIGFKQRCKVIKNKAGNPFVSVETDILYDGGVDELTGIIEGALSTEVLTRKGAYFYHEGANIAQGMAKLRETMEHNPEFVEVIKTQINEKTAN